MSRIPGYCRCGSPLARDNTDRLCNSCQGTRRRDRAPDVPVEFWLTAPMAAALGSGNLGRVIRAYRCHPFHGQALPQTIVAGWLHVSQTTLWRIETGQRRLTIDEIEGFARALGLCTALRWTPQQHEVREDVEPFSRRSLLGVGAGAAIGLSATTAPAAAHEIDPGLVSHWMSLLRLLDGHDAMFGPRDVLATARYELDLIAQHRGMARGELHTDLLRTEAHWAEFLSWLSYDAGDSHSRGAWAERALRLAQESGYPDMVAYVLMRQSQWAVAGLDARRAITLADAALRTPGTSKQIRALCTLKLAHGHALATDVAACERSLGAAYDLLAADIAEMPWGDIVGQELTTPYVMAADARCWLWLEPRKAIAKLEDALHIWPHERQRSRGVHQARLALACAAAGETDRAAAEGIEALRTARATKSHLTRRELKRLDHELAACDVPTAADFREAFAAL